MLPLVRHSGTTRARALPCFRYGYALIASLCVACATPAPPAAENVSAATATMADTDLQNYQLRALETHLQRVADGPERDYFSGMLAARSGQFGDAVAQLNRTLQHLRESAPKRAAMALEAIATAYRADNRYGDAARAYAELSKHFADQLDDSPADDAALARILSGTPPQTISWHGPVKLKTSINPIGSRVAELVVNGVRGPWLLDTGANQSLVTRTFAERLGVRPLPGVAAVGSGLTGLQTSVRAAVLPTMHRTRIRSTRFSDIRSSRRSASSPSRAMSFWPEKQPEQTAEACGCTCEG